MPKNSSAALAQRALALGYSAPIIGGVVSLLFGLIVSDLNANIADAWLILIVITFLGVGLTLGTFFSTAAFNYAATTGKSVGAIKGARSLNLVLGTIWAAISTLLAFSKAVDSVQKLKNYNFSTPTISAVTSDNLLNDFLPAFLMIAVALAGMYLLVTERAREQRA